MTVQDDKTMKSPTVPDANRPKVMSRRAVLRGGVTAMPVILTLQSGAAMARTSNLISAAPPETRDSLDRTLCLDTNSVYPVGDSGHTYDLGEPPRANVNIITDRRYKRRTTTGYVQVDESEMCTRGGTYWYKDRGGNGRQSVTLPRNGIVVSSGAMTSIADHVIDTLI